MRIGRMLRDGAPHYVVQRVRSGPWAWIDGPLSMNPVAGEDVPGDAPADGLASIDPRLLVGTANTARPAGSADPLTVFLKSPHTVAVDGAPVIARTHEGIVAEAEIAVVIGRRMASVPASDAFAHVLGCTVVNDVTDQPETARDPRLFRAKNGSAYTPAGAWIETGFDPDGARISIAVDGRSVSEATVGGLHTPIAEQLACISEWTVLEPGDVVMTGCPGTAVAVRPGQTVEVAVEGLGSVRSPVRLAGADGALPSTR